MTTYDRGPLRPYEVTWRSGRIETFMAHQVLVPPPPRRLFDPGPSDPRHARLTIHREIDGRWTLILDADYADIRSVRLLPLDEQADAEETP